MFTPALPKRKLEAIHALGTVDLDILITNRVVGFGNMQKVFLQYDMPFWDEDTDVIKFTFNDEAARSIPQDLRKHLEEVTAKIVAGEIQTRAK